MERPMEFNNVENVTLQAMEDDDDYPQLIPRYYGNMCHRLFNILPYIYVQTYLILPCCCSAVQMKEVVNATIT